MPPSHLHPGQKNQIGMAPIFGFGNDVAHRKRREIPMRNLFALVGLVVVVFGVLGWYKGWYSVTSDKGTLQVELNKAKVLSDGKKMVEKGEEILNSSDKTTAPKK